MQTPLKPKYLVAENGRKKAVVLDIKEYEDIMEMIEDLKDANDLLRKAIALKSATIASFIQ